MAWQTTFQHFVINVIGRGHQRHACHGQFVYCADQVIANQGDVLNTFAVELHQILFNLTAALARFFIERNANLAIWRGHGLGGQTGVGTLNVEVTNFAEIEQALIEVGPK